MDRDNIYRSSDLFKRYPNFELLIFVQGKWVKKKSDRLKELG